MTTAVQANGASSKNTREELYDRAKQLGIDGRSTMTKSELAEAIEDHPKALARAASRLDNFERLATAGAEGDLLMLPRLLTGNDRRMHIRQTLREDHRTRIAGNDEDTAAKFSKLAGSLYTFFRGTALLFYRDMAGEDGWMPTVIALGDVHPENFGVMPNANNVPIFGVNDFDEACYAPFTWDLKRGAVGFMVAAKEEGGFGKKKRRKIARRFVEGYLDGMARFADEGTEQEHEYRIDNAPKLIRKLIERALVDRSKWLKKNYLDEQKRGFRANDDLVPVTTRRDEFQAIIDRLVKDNGIEIPERAAKMLVKDVAERRGAGTASLGLSRYYVLIEGPRADGTDDLVLELKRARRSALAGLVPPTDFATEAAGARIVHAQSAQLVRGDIFYGSVDIDGESFMSRERAPFRDDIDLDGLSKKQWKKYANVCGHALAHAHALSDETGKLDYDIEPAILAVTSPTELFVDDIVRFAEEATDRLVVDHEHFQRDWNMGAFDSVDYAYR